jgi:hypothetical protein
MLICREVAAIWRQVMARAYSGVLGSLALCLSISRGLLLGLPPEECLSQGLVVFFGFAIVGYCIGYVANQTVCESVENRFRDEMAKLDSAAASKTQDVSDQ